jgi:AraC-like DNA-binding protein
MSVPKDAGTSSVQHAARRVAGTASERPAQVLRGGRRGRPSREHEAARWRVAVALNDIHAERATTPQAWIAAVEEHPALVTARQDLRERLLRLARLLAGASERGSLLVRRLTWERIAQHLQCSRPSVARLLRKLHRTGLLGRVARGRSAQFGTPDRNGELRAESAVYVLAVPSPAEVQPVDSGDASETPPHLPVSSKNPSRATRVRAREVAAVGGIQAARASGRTLTGTEDRRMIEDLPAAHRHAFWDVHRVPETRVEMLAAAAEMRRRSFVLRRASLRAIRSAARDFWLSGWTVGDVLRALDQRPDGTPWPHSGAQGVRSVRAWCCYRLRQWRDADGAPIPSVGERRARERELLIARQEAASRQRLRDRERAVSNPRSASTLRMVEQAREAIRSASALLRYPSHREA